MGPSALHGLSQIIFKIILEGKNYLTLEMRVWKLRKQGANDFNDNAII